MIRRLLTAALLLVATSGAAQTFYTDRLQRGIANYNRGTYTLAAQELRVAAFGLVDSPAEYELALIYEVLANDKLQHTDEATLAAQKIVHVEKVAPVYTQLRVDPAVRAALEAAAPRLLTVEELAKTPALAHLSSRSATHSPATGTSPQTQAQLPVRPDTPVAKPNLAVEAYARLQSGDDAGARDLATRATVEDYTNALAHTVLAILAGRAGDWNGVADHYSVVRTRRRLDDDEYAAYHTALVRLGRTADAAGLARVMPESARRRVTAPSAAAPAPAPVPRAAQAPFVARSDSLTALANADQLLRSGNVTGARDAYLRLAADRTLTRELALSVARGLYQTGAYRASSTEYQKLYPLKQGEELHMFYEAVNRYEMGDYSIAKLLMSRALPSLPKTAQVELYRKRIESAR